LICSPAFHHCWHQSLICEILPAWVGKLEVVGKVRESMKFSSLFKVCDLSSRGQTPATPPSHRTLVGMSFCIIGILDNVYQVIAIFKMAAVIHIGLLKT